MDGEETQENRRLMDRYLDAKFAGIEGTLTRIDANQTRLFEKYDEVIADVAESKGEKKEQDRKSIRSGGFSGAIVAACIWAVSKLTGG
ncbi:MAG: hypothetical protein JRC86_00470 [Deltaproteobacteria bacterium]|nr:hypothetical protein [Deltaproteobacteria bacterium]